MSRTIAILNLVALLMGLLPHGARAQSPGKTDRKALHRALDLLGTASAGGSAYTQEVTLGTTPFRVRIGSMASFQRDGRLFDGHGVAPDVVVVAPPEYHIGGSDIQLEEAITWIRKREALAGNAASQPDGHPAAVDCRSGHGSAARCGRSHER